MEDFYVYVYIDPRNFEEFYYGKGKDSRKDAHLYEESDSQKSKRISEIKAAGLNPIVRVIARGLSQHDALLVEKTLLWKLGGQLTNVASGHYAQNFRPHDTLHTELAGFDFQNGFYYYNVGEGKKRNWDDYVKYGIISAGGGTKWRDAILGFKLGDVFASYLKGHGYVGIGRILEPPLAIRYVNIMGRPLLSHHLAAPAMDTNADSDELCEYVAKVDWIKTVSREGAYWEPKAGLYTTTHVRASLEGQPETIKFLEKVFEFDLSDLII